LSLFIGESSTILIDTHAHLDHERFKDDVDKVVERAKLAKVQSIVTVGADLASSRQAVGFAKHYPGVIATVGVHPHDADSVSERVLHEIAMLAEDEGVVAIGEIGLDYHYDFSPRGVQRRVFEAQISLARELGLPIVVHVREAYQDVVSILRSEHAEDVGGIIHCFSGDWEIAKDCLDMGFYISVGGILTFANSEKLRGIIRGLPLHRILLETDAPYLTPVPYRGKRNEPAYVVHVAQALADLKGVTFDEVAESTTLNARKLFGLRKGCSE
jgi:TatD DNase family protein